MGSNRQSGPRTSSALVRLPIAGSDATTVGLLRATHCVSSRHYKCDLTGFLWCSHCRTACHSVEPSVVRFVKRTHSGVLSLPHRAGTERSMVEEQAPEAAGLVERPQRAAALQQMAAHVPPRGRVAAEGQVGACLQLGAAHDALLRILRCICRPRLDLSTAIARMPRPAPPDSRPTARQAMQPDDWSSLQRLEPRSPKGCPELQWLQRPTCSAA